MEKRTCKLCFKSFSNGRALGGHMRSHMLTLQTPPRPPLLLKTQLSQKLGNETELAPSASSSSSFSSSEEEEKGLCYGLRENPKKSFRMVDPEFSFAVDAGSVVQDRESETESTRNPCRRRSKRSRKSGLAGQHHQQQQQKKEEEEEEEPELKKLKSNLPNKTESLVEPEPMSSVSDTSPEEDVALCLMMLSRGTWVRKEEEEEEEEEKEEEEEEEEEKSIDETDDESNELKFCPSRNKGKYQCGTCKKVFRSYQALGGHRASHKKIRVFNTHEAENESERNVAGANATTGVVDQRIHECPICFRVFGSGQALGGHKRSHLSGSSTLNTIKNTNSAKLGENLIDLNLPAPVDDDDISQIELSAVSDAELVDPVK